MRKPLLAFTLAAGLSAFAVTASAEPVKMTDQQMDEITGGALIDVTNILTNVRRTTVDVYLDVDIDIDNSVHRNSKKDHKFSPKPPKLSKFARL